MKKALAILALALFIGGISVPAVAVNSNSQTIIALNDDDPKKEEKSAEKSKADKKSSECTTSEKKSECKKTCGSKS
jgi:hypothetical protein